MVATLLILQIAPFMAAATISNSAPSKLWSETFTWVSCDVGTVPDGTPFFGRVPIKYDRTFDIRIKDYSKKSNDKFGGLTSYGSGIEVSDPTDILMGVGQEIISFDGPDKGFAITTALGEKLTIVMQFEPIAPTNQLVMTSHLVESESDNDQNSKSTTVFSTYRLSGKCRVSDYVSAVQASKGAAK